MIAIIGIPNSGKTTLSNRFKDVVHYDDVSHLRKEIRQNISAKATVIEGVYNSRKVREEILSKTDDGYHICIWCDTPIETCLERERRGRMRGDYLVLYHAKTFEPPTLDEGWDEIIIIRGDNEQRINRKTKN